MKVRISRFFSIAAAVLCVHSGAYGADMPIGQMERVASYLTWGIGVTGWTCYQLPCPWRGVFEIYETGERGRPLSMENQSTPPPMRGAPVDLARIAEVYADHGCLAVEGRFVGQVLEVRRIVGEC